MREIVERLTEAFTRPEDVCCRYGNGARAALREQVAAEECARSHLHHEPAFPGVRHMRRVEPAHGASTKRQFLSISQSPGRTVGKIVHRHHGGYPAAQGNRLRRDSQEGIQGTAFVRLEVRQAEISEPLDRHDLVYDDQPAQTVGLDLGLSPGNVRVIRHRGIEKLKACMQAGEIRS